MRHTSWTTASNHVKPTERIYSIVDLFPGTEYQVKVTAHNNAGDTDALYNFTTVTFAGGKRYVKVCPPSQTSSNFSGSRTVSASVSLGRSVVLPERQVAGACGVFFDYFGGHFRRFDLQKK